MLIGRLLAAIAKKKTAQVKAAFEEKKRRVDESWPLGMKLGRTLVLEETPFLLADGHLVKFPGENNAIQAAGICNLDVGKGIKIFRLYLQVVPNGTESILSISVENGTNRVLEVMLWTLYDTVNPRSKEELAEWINKRNGYIGYKDFTIGETEETTVIYDRVLPSAANLDKAEPMRMQEFITDEPYDEEIIHVDHTFAVYARQFTETTLEEIMISYEEDDEGAAVRLYAGIPLDPTYIKIL